VGREVESFYHEEGVEEDIRELAFLLYVNSRWGCNHALL
jgi:hypothetical protein